MRTFAYFGWLLSNKLIALNLCKLLKSHPTDGPTVFNIKSNINHCTVLRCCGAILLTYLEVSCVCACVPYVCGISTIYTYTYEEMDTTYI